MNVSLMRKDSHIFCIACSKGNMRGGMATTTYLLNCRVSYGLGNVIHPLYIYGWVFYLMFLIHSSIYYLVVDVIFVVVQCLPCYFLQL